MNKKMNNKITFIKDVPTYLLLLVLLLKFEKLMSPRVIQLIGTGKPFVIQLMHTVKVSRKTKGYKF